MALSDKAVAEFKELYRKQLGIEVGDPEARHEAMRLLDLAKVLVEPVDSDFDTAYLKELHWPARRKKM